MSTSHTLQSLSLTQGIYDFDSERMCKILERLTKNHHLQKCVFEIGQDGLDEKLIEFIQKTKLNQLTLKFLGHVSGYCHTIKAALSSNELTQLTISNHALAACKDEAFNLDGNSELTHLTLKDCGADTAFLQAIKSLPLTYLDLSNNRLSADKAGKGLIDLLEARAETLERLNLSGHALYSTQRHPYDKNLVSAFLEDFSTALGKCKKLKSLKFDSGESAFDVHEIARFIHNIKRNNPSLVVETISLPHNSMPDKEHMFNETSQYLTFVIQDMQQQIDFKPGLSQHAWVDVSQRYEDEIARLLSELELALKEKLNPAQFRFFENYTDTGPIKWDATHKTLLKLLKASDYAAFHNTWHAYEKTHSTDDTDINLGVYLGFIDECLLFYAHAIKQCQRNGYHWVEAYPDVSVLENNYDERLTKLQHDKDEKRHAFEESRRTANRSFT